MGPKATIDYLEGMIKKANGMDPIYTECDDNKQRNAHLSWAIDPNLSNLKDKDKRSTSTPIDSKLDSTSPCQTPRECQTRSSRLLKKTSMKQPTQQISAKPELDLPQPGSGDDDETWLTEPTGCKTTNPTKVVAEATDAAEAYRFAEDPFHQHSSTQPGAEPDLPRTKKPIVMPKSAAQCSINGLTCDLPGPQSQDDDEDSSPIVQELDRAEHTQCSSYHYTLTQSGFLTATLVVGTTRKSGYRLVALQLLHQPS